MKLFKFGMKKKTNLFCECKEHRIQSLALFESAPFKDGRWTMFEVHKCLDCGKIRGFPHSNFLDALANGTDEVLKELEKLGVDVDSYKEFNPSRR